MRLILLASRRTIFELCIFDVACAVPRLLVLKRSLLDSLFGSRLQQAGRSIQACTKGSLSLSLSLLFEQTTASRETRLLDLQLCSFAVLQAYVMSVADWLIARLFVACVGRSS